MQYVNVSVLPFSDWFFTRGRALLYKNMEEENTISTEETLMVSGGSTQMGGLYWEPEVRDIPAWLVVNQSVYFGRGWSVTPVFETEGVVSGR